MVGPAELAPLVELKLGLLLMVLLALVLVGRLVVVVAAVVVELLRWSIALVLRPKCVRETL